MKKIKISAGYDNSLNLTERIIRQFKTDNIDLSNIEFVFDDSYDVIVFFNYVNEKIREGALSFVFPHEPSWTGSHQKYFDGDTTIFGFHSELYNGNFIESVAHTFYGGRGPWVDSLDFWNWNNLNNSEFKKSKIISSSITRLNHDYGYPCLYPQRYQILQRLQNLSEIDIFDGNISPFRRDALESYKFNISIENSYEKNWITEKFYDNILTDTVPIYFGCSNIQDLYPEDGYILIEDINDYDGIINLLQEVMINHDEIYKEKLIGLNKIKKRYFEDYNILNKIKNL